MTSVSSSGRAPVFLSKYPMRRPPPIHAISGYGRKPNGPSASPGRHASAAWPMSAGSVAQKSSIPLSIKKKNAHTNAPAIDPVTMTQSTKSARLMGLEKLVMQLQIVGGERMQRKHLTIFGAVSTSERARRRATSANEWRENAAPCRQLRVLRVANPVVCSRLFCGKRASSRKGRPEPKRAAFGCYSTSQGIVIPPTKPFIYALRKNVVPTDSPFDLRVIPCVSGLKNV